MKNKVCAIIAAGGSSRRMEGFDKLFAPLGGKLVLARVLDVFEACSSVDRIVVVVSRENLKKAETLVTGTSWPKVSDVIMGGARRQDSVANGLALLNDCEWVVIHDGARPLVTPRLIEDGLEAAKESGAAVAAVPVKDTIKMAGADNFVVVTPPRDSLWQVQTPQVFRHDIITEAYRSLTQEVTDDAALVERAGIKVKLYPGDERNLKITTPVDLTVAKALLKL